uniref:Uncharacterized protein n=1 Tax=Mycetohabitans sp. TaxID=2571162 RepID=A0A6B9HFH1_9BURK|nr:hypothetical protein [Mycetohabitans sp.]
MIPKNIRRYLFKVLHLHGTAAGSIFMVRCAQQYFQFPHFSHRIMNNANGADKNFTRPLAKSQFFTTLIIPMLILTT